MMEQMLFNNQGKFTLMGGGTHGKATTEGKEEMKWDKMKQELIQGLTKSFLETSSSQPIAKYTIDSIKEEKKRRKIQKERRRQMHPLPLLLIPHSALLHR